MPRTGDVYGDVRRDQPCLLLLRHRLYPYQVRQDCRFDGLSTTDLESKVYYPQGCPISMAKSVLGGNLVNFDGCLTERVLDGATTSRSWCRRALWGSVVSGAMRHRHHRHCMGLALFQEPIMYKQGSRVVVVIPSPIQIWQRFNLRLLLQLIVHC